jgi:cytochrome c oxidase accessory protein FixG
MSTLPAPERVLPTLNHDGTRRWIRPRLFTGRFYRQRLVTAWALMVIFAALPFVRIGGKPAVLLDVLHRQFTLFGRTFLPTDGVLLMLLLLSIFVGIILATALVGRAWCGWGCPQTVYMEFLYRPIERFFEGNPRGKTGRASVSGTRQFLKQAVFLSMSAVLGNLFLSYFVGTAALSHWMRGAPSEHPTEFLVMGITTALVFADFAYFREQMCTVVCPYARLQSVLLDKRSLVVAYDTGRGEPRGKKGKTTGACVDCSLCVAACPTGIDIRNGLQLECITCAQCIDACDGVMDKIGRPRGLIGYTSQRDLQKGRGAPRSFVRPRIVVYPALLIVLLVALFATASTRTIAEVGVMRGIGAPYVEQGEQIRNHVRIKIRNRTDQPAKFELALLDAPDATLVAPENPLAVAAGDQTTESVFVLAPRASFQSGSRRVRMRVSNGPGFERVLPYTLLGPEGDR